MKWSVSLKYIDTRVQTLNCLTDLFISGDTNQLELDSLLLSISSGNFDLLPDSPTIAASLCLHGAGHVEGLVQVRTQVRSRKSKDKGLRPGPGLYIKFGLPPTTLTTQQTFSSR